MYDLTFANKSKIIKLSDFKISLVKKNKNSFDKRRGAGREEGRGQSECLSSQELTELSEWGYE